MRLMLGKGNEPSLLITVTQEKSPTEFDFEVINGRWDGTYTNGYVTVWGCPSGDFSSLEKVEILTNNQDRLRCRWTSDYQEVFNNWDNPNYVAPLYTYNKEFIDMDDDIPF